MSAPETEWVDLGVMRKNPRDEANVYIRPWRPGDGLLCRAHAKSITIPCTAPIAVVREEFVSEFGRPLRSPNLRTYVYCSKHLADVVKQRMDGDWRYSSVTDVKKAAQEQVLAAHWGEYQEALKQAADAHRDRYLSVLPDSLRSAFDAIDEDEVSA